jgi:hypothetical protein
MVYREHVCLHPGRCPDTYIGRRSRANYPSPEAQSPEMELVDVIPALYSSLKLNPRSIEHNEHFPDISQLSIHEDKQSRRWRNRSFNALVRM